MSKRERTIVLAGVLMWCIAASSGGVLIAITGRGLDLADESFYLLLTKDPARLQGWLSGFGHLTHVLWNVCGHSIRAFQIAGIVATCVSGAFLGRALSVYLREAVGCSYHGMEALLCAASCLVYSWLPLTPSYNTLAVLGMMWTVAANVLLLANTRTGPRRLQWIATALGGAATAIVALAKPTTALVLGIVVVCWQVCGIRQWRTTVVVYGISACSTIGALAVLLWGGLGECVAYFKWGLVIGALDGCDTHSLAALPGLTIKYIIRGLAGVVALVWRAPVVGSVTGIALIVMVWCVMNRRSTRFACVFHRTRQCLVCGSVLIWLLFMVSGRLTGGHPVSGFDRAFVFGALWLPCMTCVLQVQIGVTAWNTYDLKRWLVPLGCLVLPVGYWMGSYNGLAMGGISACVFLVAAGAIALAEMSRACTDYTVESYTWAVIVAILVVVSTRTAQMYVLSVENVERSAWRMTNRVEMADGNVLKVSRRVKEYSEEQMELAKRSGLRQGDKLINMTGLNCGIHLLWGTEWVGFPWLGGGQEEVAMRLMQSEREEVLSSCWILTAEGAKAYAYKLLNPLSTNVLNSIGLPFPERYVKVGRVWNPVTHAWEALWRPECMESRPSV